MPEPQVKTAPQSRRSAGSQSFSIPDHELLRLIGSGAYGEVWLARNVMGTLRAVKVVFRESFQNERPYEREFEGIRKFEPVSRAHDGFVDILQAGRNDEAGYFYYVMELADDEATGLDIDWASYKPKTLASELQTKGVLPCRQCLQIGLSLSSALHHLHEHGLVHRDVKPANVVFVNGKAKLADIGLVTNISKDSSFVGSPGYIPPEGPGSPPADVFSLGRVLYEISTGKDRQEFPELPATLLGAGGEAQLLELNEVILKACEEDRRLRYKSADALHSDLLLLEGGKSIKRLRILERRLALLTRLAVIAAATILAVGVVAFKIIRENRRVAEERQRKIGAYVANGTQAMEAGDLLGALPSFAEALRLDEADLGRQRTHRLRIAAALQRAPRIVQMWFQPGPVYYGEVCPTRDEVLLSDRDGRVSLRDTRGGQTVAGWTATNRMPGKASFSGDGRWIATAGRDPEDSSPGRDESEQTIRIWNATNGALVATLPMAALVHHVEFNDDGDLVLAACAHGTAVLLDWATGKVLRVLHQHREDVLQAGFSRDGSRIVTASRDNTAVISDASTGARLTEPLRHGSWVYWASFSPDGRYVATASFDRTVRLWNATTGQPRLQPLVHRDGVRSVVFSPDGNYLLSASLDFTARLWDARTGQLAAAPLRHSGRVMHAAFSPDGRLILTVCFDGTVRLWQIPQLIPASLTDRIYSPDGGRFALFHENAVGIYDAVTTNLISSLPAGGGVAELLFSQNGGLALTLAEGGAGPQERQARLWNATTGQPAGAEFSYLPSLSGAVLSPQANCLATYAGTNVVIWDTHKGTSQAGIVFTNGPIRNVAFDRNGERVVVFGENVALLLSASSGAALTAPLHHAATVMHAEFSPDGQLLVTATAHISNLDEHVAQIWDAHTGKPVGEPLRHRDGVLHASFSPDSRRVVTSSEDFTAVIWDARTSRQLARPLEHENQVQYAVFSEDGRWVATAGQDSVARVWDSTTGEPLTPPLKHSGSLRRVQFVAGANQLLTRKSAPEWRVWDLQRTPWPAEDVALVAQLLSGRQRDYFGTMVPQSREALRRSWETLRARYPEEFSVRAPAP
jgi:WD40 repeat protein